MIWGYNMSKINPNAIYLNLNVAYQGQEYRARIQCEAGDLPRAMKSLGEKFQEQLQVSSKVIIPVAKFAVN